MLCVTQMATKKKKDKPEIVYVTCPGITEINGVLMDKNPSHKVAKNAFSVSRGICYFCRGVVTTMSQWYGKEDDSGNRRTGRTDEASYSFEEALGDDEI